MLEDMFLDFFTLCTVYPVAPMRLLGFFQAVQQFLSQLIQEYLAHYVKSRANVRDGPHFCGPQLDPSVRKVCIDIWQSATA